MGEHGSVPWYEAAPWLVAFLALAMAALVGRLVVLFGRWRRGAAAGPG
jgi:hypothetical protein